MNPLNLSNNTELAFPELALACAVYIGLISVFLGLAIVLYPVSKKRKFNKVSPLRILLFLQIPTIMLLLPAFFLISCRHFGEWAELKKSIKYYEDIITKDPLSQNGQLADNFDLLKEKYFSPAPTQYFPASGYTITFRMMSTIQPYVGIDFGGGANAIFNPRWMIMTYAD